MSGKTLNTRIQNKRGTTAEWATGTAPNFVPKDGEIVAYTDVHRIKIGDGNTKVSALPFVDKVRDVTLGGESIVNANGVVELQQTEMTDGCIPVWNNTEKIFIDSYCHNTADGLQVEGSIGMYSYEYTLDINVQDGSFSYSDDGQNTIKKYTLPITKNSGTLALTSDIPSASDFVTTNTEQTITGSKTFTSTTTYTGGITNKRSSTGRFFDCYSSASGATASTIFGVYLNNAGTSSVNPIGTVNIGSAGTQCAIELAGSAGTSGQVLTSQGSNKTPIWKTFTASAPSNMVTTNTTQTISSLKYFSGTQIFRGSVQISNGGSGIDIFNTGDSFAVSLVIDESNGLPEEGANVRLPVVDRQQAANLYLIGAVSSGTKGQVLTSAGAANAATWSTLPEFAMNSALPISYRLSSSSNGYYSSVSYGTASTVNCLMTRDLPNHISLNRHISYCIHLSTVIAAGKWVRFDVPSISYNNTTYHPYIKTITATPIKTSTSSTSPAIITYITNNQSSGGYAYVGCCSQQLNGLDVRIDCIVS